MSRYSHSDLHKRSLSYSTSKTPRRNDVLNNSQLANQNQSSICEDSSFHEERYSILSRSKASPYKSTRAGSDPELALSVEVDKLKAVNQELKKDNRILAHKLVENNEIQDRIYKLEAHNKQLLKDVAKKEELLHYKTQDLQSMKQEDSRTKKLQLAYNETLSQNKSLIDEISMLREHLESAQAAKKAVETKAMGSQMLEDQLRCANAQIEMLLREANRKNFEIEVLNNQVFRLKSENEKLRDTSQQTQRNQKIEELLKEQTNRADSAEGEVKGLKYKLDDMEAQIDGLNHKLLSFQELEGEIRSRGKNVEKISREKSNEAIKQMLQEKVRYEERINQLEEIVQTLEITVAQTKISSDEDQKHMEERIRRLQQDNEILQKTNRYDMDSSFDNSSLNRSDTNLNRHQLAEKALESVISEKINIRKLLESHIKGSEEASRYPGVQASSPQRRVATPLKRVNTGSDRESSPVHEGDSRSKASLEKEIISLNSTILTLQERIKKYELELELVREDFERQNQGRRNDINQERLKDDNAMLHIQLSDTQKKLEEVSLQLNTATKEAERTRGLYLQAVNQLEVEKKTSKKIYEDSLSRKEELERGQLELKRKDLDLRELSIRMEAERKLYSSELKQLASLNENTKEELDKLYEISAQRKHECEDYIEHNQRLKREAIKLRDLLGHYAQSNDAKTEDYFDLQDTLAHYEKEKDVLKVELERLNTQLEESNVKLSNKVDEVEEEVEQQKEMSRIIIRLKDDY